MRVLIDEVSDGPAATDLSDDRLRSLYTPSRLPWFRVNMITTVDGAATGAGGKSGDINNPADKRVFDTLRGISEQVLRRLSQRFGRNVTNAR